MWKTFLLALQKDFLLPKITDAFKDWGEKASTTLSIPPETIQPYF